MSELSRFRGYIDAQIEGQTIRLKPKKQDKWDIMEMQKDFQEKKVDMKKLAEVLERVLKQSIEGATQEEIDNILTYHSEDLLFELAIGFGWSKREDLTKTKERINEEEEKKA